jgi:acetyltransferase-like isoleucine patch superfamily enzyme
MQSILELSVLRLKRADTPAFKTLKKAAQWMMTANLPLPHIIRPCGRLLYDLRFLLPLPWRRLKSLLYVQPLFASRCESIGRRVQLVALPVVTGHTLLYVGDDVRFSGSFAVSSGRFCDHPTLRIGNRSFLGHGVTITCNHEVVIEEDVLIAGDCKISDYDGHAASLESRLKGPLPSADEIRPVRICRGAWIGAGSFILKGVIVGEGAIVGANSVVTHDVPPRAVAVGAPARVVKQTEPLRVTVAGPKSLAG